MEGRVEFLKIQMIEPQEGEHKRNWKEGVSIFLNKETCLQSKNNVAIHIARVHRLLKEKN